MTDADPEVDPTILAERRFLTSLAFRMLGTIADAEDAVQEAYVRWYRMSDQERGAIEVPQFWLRRVVSRICLDMLGSARARRETYVGPWLPEPLPSQTFSEQAPNPADRVTLDDTVSSALLVVLERMTPPERVAFVLHDVFAIPFEEIAVIAGRTPGACRQLAHSARRRVERARARSSPRREHDQVVRAFAAAARSCDVEKLVAVLDPDVVLRSDGGGIVRAARNPILGVDRAARFLAGLARKSVVSALTEQETHDGLGLAIWDEGRVIAVATLDVADGLVTDVRIVVNPAKLSLWNVATEV
jgi:RNA polymerase sigma factor (sigma-70 family)